MSSNHCIAHRLHLAGKDAASKIPYFKDYEKTLHRIYSYFSRSYKRQKMLHLMQVCLYILNIINFQMYHFFNIIF